LGRVTFASITVRAKVLLTKEWGRGHLGDFRQPFFFKQAADLKEATATREPFYYLLEKNQFKDIVD
jgi:hypothetical protein